MVDLTTGSHQITLHYLEHTEDQTVRLDLTRVDDPIEASIPEAEALMDTLALSDEETEARAAAEAPEAMQGADNGPPFAFGHRLSALLELDG